MNDLSIRRATTDDAAIVLAMVEEIARHEDQLQHLTVTKARWQEVLGRDDVVVLLAERSGGALGYVSAIRRLHLWSDRDVLALDDLYVRKGSRDDGVGRALMAALAHYAQPDGLTVTWGVESDNEAAQRFYRRLGANLRTKVIASWTPERYSRVIDVGNPETA